jgi:hypothetical protein
MRCSEARLRITGSRRDIYDDSELKDHLKTCPSCKKEARAAGVLKQIFDINSTDDKTDIVPLEAQKKLVKAVVENSNHPVKSGISIFNLLGKRATFGISAFATAAVLILFTLIPFKYEQVVGYEILFSGVDRDLVEEDATVCDILFNLDLPEADIDFLGCDTTCNLTVQFLKSEEEVERVLTAFNKYNDYDMSSNVIPIHNRTSRSLLEQVDDKLF